MAENEEVLCFDLDVEEIPVELTTKGVTKHYILRELSGKERDSYLTKMSKSIKFKDGKVAGFDSFDGIQSSLLALSLFDDEGNAVSVEKIQSFPGKVVAALHERAEALSGLDKESLEGTAGND